MNAEQPRLAAVPSKALEFKALALLALLAALVAGAVLYVLYARGAFEATQRLVLIADDTEGVAVGMDLTFAGFPIGRVRSIGLGADGAARIVIDVPRRDARWLRESSVFTLTRGLVGNTNLRAYSGILDDPPLPDGAERKVLIGDATAELPRLVAEMRELVRTLTALGAADAALAASLGNLREVTERLKGPRGALGVLFGNDADARKLVTALERADAALARLDALAANADAQLFGAAGLVAQTRSSVAQLNDALLDARGTLRKVDAVLVEAQAVAANARVATTDLGALRAEVEASLRKVDRLIDDVDRRWPFARDPQIKLP